MEGVLRDLRISLRTLLKKPSYLIAAVLVLALGIGATTAIYSFLNAYVVHPLDLPGAARIMQLWETDQREKGAQREVAPGNFLDWKTQNGVFAHLAGYRPASFNLASRGEPERVPGAVVSADFFRVLGVEPVHGRDFLPGEDAAGAPRAAVISDGLWRRRFGADPKALGGSFLANGESVTLVGVLPAGFHLPHLGHAEIWLPLALTAADANDRAGRLLDVLGRLKPGVTVQRAEAEMAGLGDRLAMQHPRPDTRIGAVAVPLEQQVAQLFRPSLLILLAASACLLLLSCANVANLQLARTSTREREIAIRVAVGAGRARLVRQLFVEGLLVAFLGMALALLVARESIALMIFKLPPTLRGYLPHHGAVAIDGSVLLFSVGVAVATAVIFGLVPAVRASRPQVNSLIQEGGRSTSGLRGRRGRALLMVSEIALALTLLIAAALMMKSFGRLQQVDPGFKAQRVLTAELDLPDAVYDTPEKQTRFYDRVLERLQTIPGVVAAAVIDHVPMGGSNFSGSLAVEGAAAQVGEWSFAMIRSASPDYFRALGIPLVEGRPFSTRDRPNSSPGVVIVNQVMAKHFWPRGSAVGKRLKRGRLDSDNPWLEIVGVAGDVKHGSLADKSSAQIYRPLAQRPESSATIVIRAEQERPASVASAVREAVLAVDPKQPLAQFQTMEQLVDNSMVLQRMSVIVLGFFGTIALLVGAVGIFSVIYYLTLQRIHEFGVRMALGASRSDVLGLVLRQGLRLVAAGLLIGVALAFGLAQAMGSLLYGVSPIDLSTYAAAALLLGVIGFLAIFLPARQASRISPAWSTRYD